MWAKFFGATLGDPVAQVVGMTLVVLMGCGVCAMGVQKGVERVVKLMMLGLLFILMALVIRSLTLPGAEAGVSSTCRPILQAGEDRPVPGHQRGHEPGFLHPVRGHRRHVHLRQLPGQGPPLTGEAMWIMGLIPSSP